MKQPTRNCLAPFGSSLSFIVVDGKGDHVETGLAQLTERVNGIKGGRLSYRSPSTRPSARLDSAFPARPSSDPPRAGLDSARLHRHGTRRSFHPRPVVLLPRDGRDLGTSLHRVSSPYFLCYTIARLLYLQRLANRTTPV
jgi:hypothetical protein